jgi:hypothetical protein
MIFNLSDLPTRKLLVEKASQPFSLSEIRRHLRLVLSGHKEMVTEEENTSHSQRQHADVDVLESASLRLGDGTLVLALAVQIGLERRVDKQNDCEDELDEHGLFTRGEKKS